MRAFWKGPYITNKEISDAKSLKKKIYNLTVSRNNKILPAFLGKDVKILNGKKYYNFIITKKMLKHKFGEFSFTRATFLFKNKKLKK